MTIVNIHLEPRRALVAANTEALRPGADIASSSKIFAIAHANAVVTGRGLMPLVLNIYVECHALPDLDAMVPKLEDIARVRSTMFRDDVKRLGMQVSVEADAYLVGWSAYCQRMVCYLCSVRDDGSVVVKEQGNVCAPWEPAWGEMPQGLSTNEAMTNAVRLQRAHVEPIHPGQGWGGDLTIAEITPESITFRSVRDFSKAE